MVLSFVAFVCLVLTIVQSAVVNDPIWQGWKNDYQKMYGNKEQMRYTIWKTNLNHIVKHNEGKHNFTLAMNQFGDLTKKEFSILMNDYQPYKKSQKPKLVKTFSKPENVKLPKSVDWRKRGYVTPVKNQLECASWAFSATGSLEGQHFKKTGKLVSLSEQNLVDCLGSGCQSVSVDDAFEYIKKNGGIDTEESYPYVAVEQKCKFNISNIGATCTGYVDILPRGNEEALKAAVGTVGPVSVVIDASHISFQFYREGVYDEPSCTSAQLDHAVLVVGYGTEGSNDYWLVKNSWGRNWGLGGYIKMSRNKDNQCGIATLASYPTV